MRSGLALTPGMKIKQGEESCSLSIVGHLRRMGLLTDVIERLGLEGVRETWVSYC